MLTRSYHNARHEVKSLGISTEEAILKHKEWMTDKEVELIRKMEVKTMKKATRRTHGNGNNARVSNITSISYAKGLNIKSMRKAPKVSDCKGSKKLTDRNEVIAKYVEYVNNAKTLDDTAKIYGWTEKEKRIRPSDKAKIRYMLEMKDREIIRKESDSKTSSKKQTSKKSKKTDSKKPAKKETKKATKKETTKKASTKKPSKKQTAKKDNKGGVKESANQKRFELRKGNTTYRFTVTKNRGILVRWNGNYRYCRTEEARWMYRNLLNDGYKRVA